MDFNKLTEQAEHALKRDSVLFLPGKLLPKVDGMSMVDFGKLTKDCNVAINQMKIQAKRGRQSRHVYGLPHYQHFIDLTANDLAYLKTIQWDQGWKRELHRTVGKLVNIPRQRKRKDLKVEIAFGDKKIEFRYNRELFYAFDYANERVRVAFLGGMFEGKHYFPDYAMREKFELALRMMMLKEIKYAREEGLLIFEEEKQTET